MGRATNALAFIYSGGSGNSNPQLSIGGQASTAAGCYIASQQATTSTISGVTILHAARNPQGIGTLSFTVIGNRLTWLPYSGSPSQITIGSSGVYTVGTTTTGFLRVSVDTSLFPVSDTSQSITISNATNTLFGAPTATDLTNGSTEYRCVYLKNESAQDISTVALTLTDNAAQSSIHIGSSFDPLSNYGTSNAEAQAFYNQNRRTMSGMIPACLSTLAPREGLGMISGVGHPFFLYYPTDTTQNSDGVSVDVPPVLQDRNDSTGMLSSIVWGNNLSWPYIRSGRMISFWIRRIIPPNPTVPTSESFDLDLSLILT